MYGAYYMCGFNWINQLMFFQLAPVGSACLFAAMLIYENIL